MIDILINHEFTWTVKGVTSACRLDILPGKDDKTIVILSHKPGCPRTITEDVQVVTSLVKMMYKLSDDTIFIERYPASAQPLTTFPTDTYSVILTHWENGVNTIQKWKYITHKEMKDLLPKEEPTFPFKLWLLDLPLIRD